MPPAKTSFLDKVLGRLTRLDTENVRTLLHRLAEERSLLETIFNIVEDGILVVAEDGGSSISIKAPFACWGSRNPRAAEGPRSRTCFRNSTGRSCA